MRWLPLVLLTALGVQARAQEAVPRASAPGASGQVVAGSPLESVEVGFSGGYGVNALNPVWATLVHPLPSDGSPAEALEVTLVARGGSAAPAEERVTLPPGSRKRVCLAVRIQDDSGLLLDVIEAGQLVERREITDLVAVDNDRHLLIVDGRPPEQRRGAASNFADPVLRHSTLTANSAPPEAGCYTMFGAVILLGVDPTALDVDAREALLEHVTNGGTLLLAETGPQRLTASFFRDTFGPPTQKKLLDRMADVWHVGLGRVVSFPDDILQAVQGTSARAARLKQRLGDLVSESFSGNVSPRIYDELELNPFEGPGKQTRLLVLGFLGLYFLVVGPILALAFRRLSRRRLALVTAALVLAFCLLAPGVAGIVRSTGGAAYQRTVQFVPLRGPAFELGEITAVSGGGTSYELSLSGPRIAATVFPSGQVKEHSWSSDGRVWARPMPPAQRTRRGEQVTVSLSMSPWGRQSVNVQSLAPLVRPLEAQIEQRDEGLVLTVVNTSGQTLRNAIVMDVGTRPDSYAEYVAVGTLPPGARAEVPLNPDRRGGQGAGRDKNWHEYLGLSGDWRSWRSVVAPGWRELQGRYQLISRVPSTLTLHGEDLEVVTATLRIDELRPWRSQPKGFMGVEISDDPSGAGVLVDRPMPGGPASRAGILSGDIILFVDTERVRTVTELQRLVNRRAPGDELIVDLRDTSSQTKRVKVVLVSRHVASGGR